MIFLEKYRVFYETIAQLGGDKSNPLRPHAIGTLCEIFPNNKQVRSRVLQDYFQAGNPDYKTTVAILTLHNLECTFSWMIFDYWLWV